LVLPVAVPDVVGDLSQAVGVGGGLGVGDDTDRAGVVHLEFDHLVVQAAGDGGRDDEGGLVADLLGQFVVPAVEGEVEAGQAVLLDRLEDRLHHSEQKPVVLGVHPDAQEVEVDVHGPAFRGDLGFAHGVRVPRFRPGMTSGASRITGGRPAAGVPSGARPRRAPWTAVTGPPSRGTVVVTYLVLARLPEGGP